MSWIYAISVAAIPNSGQNLTTIFVYGGDKIVSEMPMPDDALIDDLHAPSPA